MSAEWKKLYVSVLPAPETLTNTVILNGVLPEARLTPQMAEAAARVALGHRNGVTVWDYENNVGYRLYTNSARKLYPEPEREGNMDEDWKLTTEDRVEQVNWLRELAGNIAANLGEGSAEELVAYALSSEGRESWGIEVPQWFDAHDKGLLIQWVNHSL